MPPQVKNASGTLTFFASVINYNSPLRKHCRLHLVDFVAQQSQGLQRHVAEENKINKFPEGPVIKTVICYILSQQRKTR